MKLGIGYSTMGGKSVQVSTFRYISHLKHLSASMCCFFKHINRVNESSQSYLGLIG